MRSLADDADDDVKPSGPSKGQAVEQPAWMRTLLERCREWLSALPEASLICLSLSSCSDVSLYSPSVHYPSRLQITRILFADYSFGKVKLDASF